MESKKSESSKGMSFLRRTFRGLRLVLLLFATNTSHAQYALDAKTIDSLDRAPVNERKKKDPLLFIEGQLCQHVRVIFEDSRGNLWFGTNVYGLMRYNGATLDYFIDVPGLPSGRITGIVEDSAGMIWIAHSFGLSKFDGTSFTNYTKENGLLTDELWSLIINKKGELVIGTNVGLSIFDGKTFRNIDVPKGDVEGKTIYSRTRITAIAEVDNGDLWLGTDGFGLVKYDGTNFTRFTIENGLSDNVIASLFIDSKKDLWIGTVFGGVNRFDGTTLRHFTDPLLDGAIEISAFYEDTNGEIWFGAENHGVFRYDGKEFTNYYEEANLPTNGILCMFRDSQQRFWFGGWGGLFRFDGSTFESVSEDGPWEHTYQPTKTTPFEQFVNEIPMLNLPFELNSTQAFDHLDIVSQFIPEGAAILGRLPSKNGMHFLLCSYPRDIRMPILEIYNSNGSKIKEVSLFNDNCLITNSSQSKVTMKDYGTFFQETICGEYDSRIDNDTIVVDELIKGL